MTDLIWIEIYYTTHVSIVQRAIPDLYFAYRYYSFLLAGALLVGVTFTKGLLHIPATKLTEIFTPCSFLMVLVLHSTGLLLQQ